MFALMFSDFATARTFCSHSSSVCELAGEYPVSTRPCARTRTPAVIADATATAGTIREMTERRTRTSSTWLDSQYSGRHCSLSTLDRDVPLRILRPDVVGARADQAVVRVLF